MEPSLDAAALGIPSEFSIPWSTSAEKVLAILADPSVDGYSAKKVNLFEPKNQPGSFGLTLRAERFWNIHATVVPVGEPDSEDWDIHWSSSNYNEKTGLAEMVAQLNPDKVIRLMRPKETYSNRHSYKGEVNVLHSVVAELEKARLKETFAALIREFPDIEIFEAGLEPSSRFMSGVIEGRRFEVHLGKKNKNEVSVVVLYPGLMATLETGDNIYNVGLNEELILMPTVMLFGYVLRRAYVLEVERNSHR